ncbi:MAG: Hsp70 family protein [Pseudomonadota bacterium]|nr:Hsp70 family protein [Pseudomonadota bacterium]
MAKYVAGIDFGTTNSAAAISDGATPRMVDVEGGKDTIPTALFFADKTNSVHYGRDAQNKYTNGDGSGRFMRSMKRILGSQTMRGGTVVNGKMTRFDTIIEYFVKHLKQKIDKAAGTKVEYVVMGRPVHFRDNDPAGDAQAQAELEKIALAAGFKYVAFQYEPIAAAFAHEQNLTSEKLAFVVDIGGGTSDFTIIRLSPERKFKLDRAEDVLANTGVRIGGNDFDKALSMKSFMPCFGLGTEYKSYDKNITIPTSPYISLSTWSSVNEVYNYKTLNVVRGYTVWGLEPEKIKRLYEIIENRLGHKNLDYVENAKMALSSQQDYEIVLDFLTDAPLVKTNRSVFEDSIKSDIAKIEKSVQECIAQAGIKNTDIELVILTGGSTEIPYVSRVMQSYFPNAELSSANKMASVGLGLAYDAMRRFAEPQHTK